jgi:hypothetical protein
MPGVGWDNQSTERVYEALISQPEAIHIAFTPHLDETAEEFADRLRTLVGALIRAVEEFGLEGAICTWLVRVDN